MSTMELNKLPDFDDLDRLVFEIRDLSLEAEYLDVYIKAKEAEIIEEYTSNPEKFVSGKVISMTQLKSTVAFTGENGELVEKRRELARARADLEAAKLKFGLERSKIDVWRTQSANERLAVS